MASSEILVKEATPIVWADEADYAVGAKVGGERTHDLDLTELLFTEARQGVKVDLGETRARRYAITLAVEFKAGEAPESGELAKLYWGPSGAAAAGVANQGGLVGTDAPYTGTAGDSLEDSLEQLILIGPLSLTVEVAGTPQRDTWVFSPPTRYGQPVVVNGTDTEDFNDVDAQEMYVRMVPLIDESQ